MPRLTCSALLVAAFVALPALPAVATAQDTGNGFLFGAPSGSFALRGGWALASAGSDYFAFTTNELTLKKRDFSSLEGAADINVRLGNQTALVFSTSVSAMTKGSEFRNFIDNNNLPIQQSTTFRRVPVTLGVKRYLTPTGRSIGKFAWIPERVAPYVGVGGGTMYYDFKQSGDFIDMQSLNVFHSIYAASGWTGVGYLNAGADFAVGSMFALTTDVRYMKASGPLSQDFSGFHRLDLSGLSTTVGFAVRF